MALSRYASPDLYTLEELRREYQVAGPNGRVRLLRRLSREVGIPADLLGLAVKDEHSYVRQWVASHAYLYGDFEAQIANDPDDFIRSCLKENPSCNHFWLSKGWQEAFQHATPWERLAMVRHPHVDDELIEKIFDPENNEFGLEMESRSQLASAFLSNEGALNRGQFSYSDWCDRVGSDDASGFIDIHQSARKHYDNIWALAAKWPAADIELGVRYWVYQYVGVDDKMKSKTYKECKEAALRRAILRNKRAAVDPYGSSLHENPATSELIKLAMNDPDIECRKLALDRGGSESRTSRKAKYLSYTWSAFWASVPNAIGAILALKILSSASSRVETLIFALLVLLYNAVTWISMSHGAAVFEQAAIGARRYVRLLELLKDPLYTGGTKEDSEESIKNQEERVRKNGVLFALQSVWSLALTAIALYYLVPALI